MHDNVVTDLDDLVSAGSRLATIYADPPWRYNNTVSRGADLLSPTV